MVLIVGGGFRWLCGGLAARFNEQKARSEHEGNGEAPRGGARHPWLDQQAERADNQSAQHQEFDDALRAIAHGGAHAAAARALLSEKSREKSGHSPWE